MLRGAIRSVKFLRKVVDLRLKIHSVYKSFVPPRWRAATRWVWGIAAVSAFLWGQFTAQPPALVVYFYDVGQGDAIHVRTPEGFDVLIDGGPTARIGEKFGRTLPFWDKTIEMLVLTHPHADHLVGQIEVLRRFKVEKVLATGVLHTTNEYITWLEEIRKQGVSMEVARAGQEYILSAKEADQARRPLPQATPAPRLGSNSPRSQIAPPTAASAHTPLLEILWPQEDFSGKRVAERKLGEGGGLNDTSIVARLEYGKTSFMLMGDATSAVEEKLLEDSAEADVLKVGHHGSKYSTSRAFLETVQPKYAIIQVGKNTYGHPAFATLWRLKQAGVKIMRNDQNGDVIFTSDGEHVELTLSQ